MHEHAQYLEEPERVESSKAIEHKPSQTCTFVRCTTSLRKLQIPSGSLLDQCRENRTAYADNDTGKPYDVDHDGQFYSLERLGILSSDVPEWYPTRHVEKLLRYPGELSDRLIE